mmetsp:Transcript_32249/g.64009  ORF Transcript_32249/g.64009 Transcript_32249/m.64009 type:complete len:124 (-) Transcript_32249:28-399(-)
MQTENMNHVDGEGSSSSSRERLFVCSLCAFSCPFDHFGQTPPYEHPKFRFLEEEVFSIRNPFPEEGCASICLGGKCSKCRKPVCVDEGCSVFYGVRVCRLCVNPLSYPSQMRAELEKMKKSQT